MYIRSGNYTLSVEAFNSVGSLVTTFPVPVYGKCMHGSGLLST